MTFASLAPRLGFSFKSLITARRWVLMIARQDFPVRIIGLVAPFEQVSYQHRQTAFQGSSLPFSQVPYLPLSNAQCTIPHSLTQINLDHLGVILYPVHGPLR